MQGNDSRTHSLRQVNNRVLRRCKLSFRGTSSRAYNGAVKRRIGYAVACIGAVLVLGSYILRTPSFVILNGYYAETWRLGVFAGAVLLTLGAIEARRAG